MDLSGIELLIPDIAAWLNIEPATLLLILVLLGTGSNILSRLIPDDAPGWLGQVRRIASILGAHLSNRITKGITVTEVAQELVGTITEHKDEIQHLAENPSALIPEVTEERAVEDPFGQAARKGLN